MGLLSKKFNEAINNKKSNLGTVTDYIPYYRTGIDIFDYINGTFRSDGSLALGIPSGKIMMDVGASGTGKTSYMIKTACSIAEQFEECDIWHYDFERSTSKERVLAISGWDEEMYDEKYRIFSKDISVETLYNACKEIEKIKLENKDEIMIEMDGHKVLPPTIILVDSVALMAPEEIENDDELRGSMGASAMAKANTNVFKRIMNPCENANIIVLLVNHLTDKIEIGPVKTKAQINYLKQDQSIPGGKAVSYLTNTLLLVECGAKLTPDKELGIKGYYLNGLIVKSRSTESGTTFKMVFEQAIGINNLLTNFVNLKDLGRITGAARSFKLDTCPDIKFSLKDFQDKYYDNEELREAFDKAVEEEFTKFVTVPKNKKKSKKEETKVSSKKKKTSKYTLIDEENEVYEKDGKYYIIEDDEYVEVDYE